MITGVILARNEESNIVDCIAALRPQVSEILLIDMESNDRTVELATPLVNRVLTHPLVPNFDAARNVAIPVATNDWMWFVDADERIPETTGRIVHRLIREQGHEFEAINIPFKSYFCGQWMKHCGWWPGYTCPRVLKRGSFEFSRTLHGGVKLNGREIRLPPDAQTGIEHYSFRDLHHYIEKFNRYTSTEALQLAERGVLYDWRGAVRFMAHDLWEHYELHNARLDGERGWILTWLAGQYRWLSVAKLLDHGKSSEQAGVPSSVPRDLDEFTKALEEELASFRTQTPELPFGVVWRAAVWDTVPGVTESRNAVLGLARGERAIVLEALPGPRNAALDGETDALLRALGRCRRARHVITVTQWGPIVMPPDRCACYNVLRIPTGVSVPLESMAHVNAYDEVWVESANDLDSLQVLGAAPERLRCIAALDHDQAAHATSGNGEVSVLERELCRIEGLFQKELPPSPADNQIRVVLEGEFFAGHSFSNINEQLALRLSGEPSLALTLQRTRNQVGQDVRAPHAQQLNPYLGRQLEKAPQVVVRHAFPPNWQKPQEGRWVHIQPWEFGSLLNDWLPHLRDEVDEIWVMSKYVEAVYRNSGIASEKLQYIPWGIDPNVFRPDAPPRQLPTDKSFRFLYVGGTILRKGFDRVLAAYLAEFNADDDVCLVVKDVGTHSFYGPQSMRGEILEAINKPGNPAIVYLEEEMTAGQLASLYTACHCLVAPYRGEGFGLPILEALACGVPPIVPRGGPTDDFVDEESGFILSSLVIPAEGIANLCGPATELHISLDELRNTMRQVVSHPEIARKKGINGSQRVRQEFTWEATAAKMVQRLQAIAGASPRTASASTTELETLSVQPTPRLALVIGEVPGAAELIDSLGRVRPFVTEAIVFYNGADDRVARIAHEYGATVVRTVNKLAFRVCDWVLFLRAGEYVPEEDLEALRRWLPSLPSGTERVCFNSIEDPGNTAAESLRPGIRLLRWMESLTGQMLMDSVFSAKQGGSEVGSAVSPFHVKQVPSSAPNQVVPARLLPNSSGSVARASTEIPQVQAITREHGMEDSLATTKFGRLGKSVLIQMATGPHVELLELTRDHHRRYAQWHGMDYWCIAGSPTQEKRASWGKVPLLRSAIEIGYETVVWLDADAVIVHPEVDLARLVEYGIGMVRHPHPQHWNAGFMVTRASAITARFWRDIDATPENAHPWMEQYAVNQLASQPEFAKLLQPLDLQYNSVPGYVMAQRPVIVAAHGLPMPQRYAILKQALADATKLSAPTVQHPARREDFGSYLNEVGLVGEAVEIGVHRGEYSRVLLDRWQGRLLHLVDPWRHLPDYQDITNLSDEEFEQCLEATRRNLIAHAGRFRIHRLKSAEAVRNFSDASLDFVYLDANHHFDAVSQDLRLWFPKLKPGGILAGHDFLDGELPEGSFGVASAVRCFLQDIRTELHVTEESAWPSWYFFKP